MKALNRTLSLFLVLAMIASLFVTFPVYATESTIDTSNYTVSLFKDGTGDGVDDIMTIDKWTIPSSPAENWTAVTDGVLIPKGGYAAPDDYLYLAVANTTVPNNYVAEMTGVLYGEYYVNASVRLKTVDGTHYYFLVKRDGAGGFYYGITTDAVGYTNAQISEWKTKHSYSSINESANWKFVVINDAIEVYKDGTLLTSYTDEALASGTGTFALGYQTHGTTSAIPVKASYVNILREKTADEIAIEEAEKACTKTVLSEDFETNEINKYFTSSTVPTGFTLQKSVVDGDTVMDLGLPSAKPTGTNNMNVKLTNPIAEKSITEFNFRHVGGYPEYGRIILGKIGSNYVTVSTYEATDTWGIIMDKSLTADPSSPNKKVLTAGDYGLGLDKDIKVKVVATDTNVYILLNDILAYTYTYAENETDRFVSMPGISALTNWYYNRHVYLDDITIKQEPTEEEKTIENCTKTVLYEDFETNDVNVNFTASGSKYEVTKAEFGGDNVLAFKSTKTTSNTGNEWAHLKSKNSFSGNSVTEFTINFQSGSSGRYPDNGQIVLGQIGDKNLSLCSAFNNTTTGALGFGLVSSQGTVSSTSSAATYGVSFDTDLKFKVVATNSNVIVYINNVKRYTYTYAEDETDRFVSAPGISIGINYFGGRYIYLDDVSVKQELTEEDNVSYTITGIPESGTVENATTKRITISAETDGLANNIKNTISLKANGEEVGGAFMYPDSKTVMINVNKLTSNTDYTLTFTPGYKYGVTQKTYTFTTGTITPVTNVAEDATVTSNTEKTRWVYALDSSYDLTEVAVTGAAGATVKLTRDENLTAEKMTTLGTVTDGNTMEISGDKIGRYKYIVIESETAIETAPIVSAAKSDLGDDWLKQRTLNMANADMRFASFSDLHNLATTTNDTLNTVMSGFDAMSNDIDAMTLVGDIVYWNPDTTLDSDVAVTDGVVTGAEEGEDIDIMTNRYKVLSDALNTYGYNNKQNNKTDGKATIWAIGNHEYAEPYSNYTIREAKTDVIVNNCIGYYDTHQVVNGYHLIGAALSSGLQITAEKAQWILDEVEAAEAEDPTKPIFVFTHVKLPDMVYPDNKTYNGTNYWNTAGSVIAELKKHKQVIVISGHEHAIAQLPGNIGQDGLTQVMLGVTGGGNMGRNPGTVNANSTPIYPGSYNPQGLMFEVKDNVTYIYRIDLKDQAVIGEPWVIDAEGRVNEQLEDTYTKARYENATAPYFEEGAIDNVEISKSGTNLVVKFPQAKTESAAGDNYVKAYEIHVKYPRTNSDIVVTSDISDYYFLNAKTSMSETMSLTFAYPELLNSFDCNVEIYPVSTYHVYGEPLVKTVEAVNQDTGLTEEELAKAKPDADVICLDFYEKSTTDCVNGVKPAVTDVISSLSYDEAYNTDKIRLLPLSNGKTYQYFGGTNYLTYTIDNAPENGYTLEASFNMPTAQKKQAKASASLAAVEHKLIGTDAHSLYVDESSNVVFKYTVDGTAKTIKCPVPTSAWFHATATLSGTEAKLYIDGRVVASATVSGTIDPFGTDVSLGNNAILSVLKARVYGRALSVGEVDKLMTEHNTVLTGDTADSQIKLLSLNAPVTTLSGSYEASSGSESVLTDGTLSGSIDTATVIYGSKSMDIKIDLGKEYDADTIVLYAAKHYINHRMELTVQASREEADSDKSLRTNLVTVPRTGPNSGYDVAGNPIYLTVPDGVGPVRYIYLSKTEVSGLNCFALILAEVQVFGRECDPVREARIADVDYTDTAVTAVTLKSTSATPGTTCTIVIATYDEEDNMISAEYVENITLNKDYKEQTIEITNSPDLTNADKAKVFVWTDLDNIEPVMDCCVIK